MTLESTDQFYSRLPVNEIPLCELLTEEHLFYKVPGNWHVVITDIKNSTLAVQNGLHETINLVATGCIVAVLNIAQKHNLSVPFFFGGDGATFLLPPIILEASVQALLVHSQNTHSNFNLFLRVGTIPMTEIYKGGKEVNICKFKTSEIFSIPLVLGNGLAMADKIIKGEDYGIGEIPAARDELDLSGMECRWDTIEPPDNAYEVVSLLVISREGIRQSVAFKKVINCLDEIYGAPQQRQPISVSKLKLRTTLAKLKLEMNTKLGGLHLFYLVKTWLQGLFGYIYFRTKKGKFYLNRLVEMSDTLIIDGKVNTVIAGTSQQRERLKSALQALEGGGEIFFGLYVSKESVMSCYVKNRNDRHIHFVDGAEGGYTKASEMLKKKIKNTQH